MTSSPDSVGDGIMFLDCPIRPSMRSFVRLFVQSDIVAMISHEQF